MRKVSSPLFTINNLLEEILCVLILKNKMLPLPKEDMIVNANEWLMNLLSLCIFEN